MPVTPAFVAAQVDTLWTDVRIDAAKIGMLGQASIIETLAERLAHWRPNHVVLDPVMVAKSGDALLDRAAVGALREALLPHASVITPNLPEAGVLLEARAPETVKEMYRAAERLRELMRGDGERWVLLKGGHLPGSQVTDLLHDGDRMIEMSGARIETKNTRHGLHLVGRSGDADSAELDMPTAARHAKAYLTSALEHAGELAVGADTGLCTTCTRCGLRTERAASDFEAERLDRVLFDSRQREAQIFAPSAD
jgi:hydroxymethylpyrimidine/phosphomethylpyrimidine kinase